MSELTKRHCTDDDCITITFTGPSKNRLKAISALKKFGFKDTSDSINWRDAFPEYDKRELPGVCLAAARDRENITQAELSRLTGISIRYISEMENGKRRIEKEHAKVLARVLNVGYKVFLN